MRGYDQLTDEQKTLFNETHAAHLSTMGEEMKKNHTRENIKKVTWDKAERCLKVYFNNGEWYHYLDCKWY